MKRKIIGAMLCTVMLSILGCGSSETETAAKVLETVESTQETVAAESEQVETQEEKEFPAELVGLEAFDSLYDLRESDRQYLKETLQDQPALGVSKDVFLYSYYGAGDDGTSFGEEMADLEKISFSNTYFTIDANGIPVVFDMIYTVKKYEEKYYVVDKKEWNDMCISSAGELDTESEGFMDFQSFCYSFEAYGSYLSAILELQENDDAREVFSELITKSGLGENDRFSELLAFYLCKNEETRALFERPETAVQAILHLSDVESTEVIPAEDLLHVIVTFANGDQVKLGAELYGGNRLETPLYVFAHTYSDVEQDLIVNQWLDELTAAKLKAVDKKGEKNLYDVVMEPVENEYVLLSKDSQKDAALYAMHGGDAFVLRVKNQVVPIRCFVGRDEAGFWILDLDQDGSDEYVISFCWGWGTGYYVEKLYVVKLQGEDVRVLSYGYDDFSYEKDRITSQYDAQWNMINYYIDDPDRESPTGELLLGEKEPDVDCVGLGFGDQMGFFEADEVVYLWAEGGVLYSDRVQPDYEKYVLLLAPIRLNEKGQLKLGEITLDSGEFEIRTEDVEQERVVNIEKADVTHDGVDDHIVTSVTYFEESKDKSLEDLLDAGHVLYVRVYDGAVLEGDSYSYYYDPENYVKYDGYNPLASLYEHSYASAHAGNGQLFLTKEDGKWYLLEHSDYAGQGMQSFSYRLLILLNENFCQEIVKEEVSLSYNFDVPGSFTEENSLAEYDAYKNRMGDLLKNSIPLVDLSIDRGCEVRTKEHRFEYRVSDDWMEYIQ